MTETWARDMTEQEIRTGHENKTLTRQGPLNTKFRPSTNLTGDQERAKSKQANHV